MYCKNCGKKIEDNSRFCPHCGANLVSSVIQEKDQDQILKRQSESETLYTRNQGQTASTKKKKSAESLVFLLPVVAVIAVGGLWLGNGRTGNNKTENSSVESSMIEESKQEAEESVVEESSKFSVPLSEGGEAEVSTGISPDEYILPECETRIYTREELSALSKDELRLARNEIYARHGRKFSAEDLRNYFQNKSWYTPLYEAAEFDAKGDSVLNDCEIANRNLIVELE